MVSSIASQTTVEVLIRAGQACAPLLPCPTPPSCSSHLYNLSPPYCPPPPLLHPSPPLVQPSLPPPPPHLYSAGNTFLNLGLERSQLSRMPRATSLPVNLMWRWMSDLSTLTSSALSTGSRSLDTSLKCGEGGEEGEPVRRVSGAQLGGAPYNPEVWGSGGGCTATTLMLLPCAQRVGRTRLKRAVHEPRTSS